MIGAAAGDAVVIVLIVVDVAFVILVIIGAGAEAAENIFIKYINYIICTFFNFVVTIIGHFYLVEEQQFQGRHPFSDP